MVISTIRKKSISAQHISTGNYRIIGSTTNGGVEIFIIMLQFDILTILFHAEQSICNRSLFEQMRM